jgi:hypothetical protein
MQLDATLRSFFLHGEDTARADVRVVYQTTTPVHARQYGRLQREYEKHAVSFVRERRFRDDFLRSIVPDDLGRLARAGLHVTRLARRIGRLAGVFRRSVRNRYVLFLVDDNLFVRPFELGAVSRSLADHPDALGFSLRLGKNTGYCYAHDQPQSLPGFSTIAPGILKFDWTRGEADFGYPLEVSSSVYRLRDMLPFLSRLPFRNPNTLEEQMAHRTGVFRQTMPQLLCYEASVTFCNPINKVQTVLPNRAGEEPEHSSETLAELFEKGYRVDVGAYEGFVPTGCHQEVELRLHREQDR